MTLEPQLPQSSLASVRAETDGRIAVARWGPLEVDVRVALGRQAELTAPVKLALSRGGECELRAEVLHVGGLDAPKLARGALDAARAWLAGEPYADDEAPIDEESLEDGLAELPRAWAWERAEDGIRVHATAFGESVRLEVEAVAGGVRVMARSALPTPDPIASDALVHFALDANRRLRLARIGLSAADGGATVVTWDVVTPSGVVAGCGVPTAVEAVVRAHAATRRSLRALGHGPVARLYLDSRELWTRGNSGLEGSPDSLEAERAGSGALSKAGKVFSGALNE